MNDITRKENARSLADILGSSEGEASELLNICALITVSTGDEQGAALADSVQALLSRTFTTVVINRAVPFVAVEIVVGGAVPTGTAPHVFVSFVQQTIVIGRAPEVSSGEGVHPFACLLAACYCCGAAMKVLLGDRLKYPTDDRIVVDLNVLLGDDARLLGSEHNFGEAFLAGAGAIGNGFVFGVAKLPLRGTLHIADDDLVSYGNLQRCIYFDEVHIDQSKAEVLAERGKRATGDRIVFVAHHKRLQFVPQRMSGPWLRRLVVAVDSPRARRSLQTELPKEVFDASTTGAEEIVLHFNCQPSDKACMACVYDHTVQEDARERHIAESLGIALQEVRESRVSEASALSICKKFNRRPDEVIGMAYDTLFKNLCASAELFSQEGRQVLTPFAFVSTLAGLMLALEFWRRGLRGHNGHYNKWSISPWANPVLRARRILERKPDCEVCGNPIIGSLFRSIWMPREN